MAIRERFRGYLPVVVDVETSGLDSLRHGLLEVAAVIIETDENGSVRPGKTVFEHVLPFDGAELDPKALAFTGIDPFHPFRQAVPEEQALRAMFSPIRQAIKASGCNRAILVGHNAAFDLSFLYAASERCKIKRNPFHPFSTLDTVTLGAMACRETVLAKTAKSLGFSWDSEAAHSALYDAERTAEVFCKIINQWDRLAGSVDRQTSRRTCLRALRLRKSLFKKRI